MADDDKPDEQKSERFNMFMSPSEMKAIDEWAWKNRVRSKSEAVRRLVNAGLELDRGATELLDHILQAMEKLNRQHAEMELFLDSLPESGIRSQEQSEKLAELYSEILTDIQDETWVMLDRTSETIMKALLREYEPRLKSDIIRSALLRVQTIFRNAIRTRKYEE